MSSYAVVKPASPLPITRTLVAGALGGFPSVGDAILASGTADGGGLRRNVASAGCSGLTKDADSRPIAAGSMEMELESSGSTELKMAKVAVHTMSMEESSRSRDGGYICWESCGVVDLLDPWTKTVACVCSAHPQLVSAFRQRI